MEETLGQRLLITRQQLKYSQKDFAKLLNIYPPNLARIEKDERSITLQMIVRLAELQIDGEINIDLLWILTGKRNNDLDEDIVELISKYNQLSLSSQMHIKKCIDFELSNEK